MFRYLFATLAVVTGAITLLVQYYSGQTEEIGTVYIYSDRIILHGSLKSREVDFKNMQNFTIERGSNYHYAYQGESNFVDVDNWLIFRVGKEEERHEFLIDSAEKNKELESLLAVLKQRGVRVKFLSV